jgi:hypothetical protein
VNFERAEKQMHSVNDRSAVPHAARHNRIQGDGVVVAGQFCERPLVGSREADRAVALHRDPFGTALGRS